MHLLRSDVHYSCLSLHAASASCITQDSHIFCGLPLCTSRVAQFLVRNAFIHASIVCFV
jgi:hypothetical protein